MEPSHTCFITSPKVGLSKLMSDFTTPKQCLASLWIDPLDKMLLHSLRLATSHSKSVQIEKMLLLLCLLPSL